MRMISNRSWEFLKNALAYNIKEFLDDPDGQVGGDGPEELKQMAETYEELCVVCKDCEVKFWDVAVAEGTSYEIERLLAYLKDAGVENLPEFASLPEGRNGF